MSNKSYTVPANDSITPAINARYIYIQSLAIGSELRVRGSGKGGSFDYKVVQGSKIGPADFSITEIEIINDTGSAIDVELKTGNVFYDENILSGSIALQAPGSFAELPDVQLTAATATLIMAADTTRKEAFITSWSGNANTIKIGGSTVAAARGTPLEVGATLTIETTAAIYGYCSTADWLLMSYTGS